MTPEYILLALLVCYGLQVVIQTSALYYLRDHIDPAIRPFVTVVIAARDEESNIAACLRSVLAQTYDLSLYEVVVVNDHSTDRTEEICLEFAEQHRNLRLINAVESSRLRGKSNALDQGIAQAQGEIILITDADCTVPDTWIAATARRYGPKVGMVGGLTIQHSSSSFGGMQALDWAFLLGLAASTISLKIPLSTIGNNLSFRKSAYEQVGGYAKIPFSVTEDFMLFQAIVRTGIWDYLCPVEPDHLVTSQPCQTWQELLRQKQRWGKGGLDMRLSGLLVMVIGFGVNALLLYELLSGEFLWFLGALGFKAGSDLAFLSVVLSRLKQTRLLKYFAAFELYFIIYVLLLPFVVFFGGKVIWKGRAY